MSLLEEDPEDIDSWEECFIESDKDGRLDEAKKKLAEYILASNKLYKKKLNRYVKKSLSDERVQNLLNRKL